ncbi:hypothetical protein QBC46DRAFT_461583 [Diplogelasinospora grovesii]|uniref:FAR1 domain-containing protein n=1 Tax=Diplogelasinospora grovesii TaxID=303347 RepID=A0AAN6MZA4_9PEZI|nr:hypothetical protein QBC46DRAFT_461583 [Diplogelasinospora grovesii]
MSAANTHPGLSFGVGGMRRAFPPPHNPPSKPGPTLSQHASPYQSQAYTPQQPPQAQYPHHLFSSTPPPQVPNVASLQNASRPPPSQAPPTLPGPRQRAPAPRQMQHHASQPNPSLTYLQQSLNQQPISQQPMNPQQLSQQSLSQQSLGQQSLGQQPLGQQPLGQQPLGQQSLGGQPLGGQPLGGQSLGQQSLSQQAMNQQPMNPQQLSQQSLGQQPLSQQPLSQQIQQPMSQPPMTQSLTQQTLSQPVQQNENPILAQQSITRPPPPPTPPATQPQLPQVQQVQKVQSAAQQRTPPQPEPVEPAQESHHDDDIEMGSQDEGEGHGSLDAKMGEGPPFVPRQPMGAMMSAPPEGGSFPTLEAVHKHVLRYCTSVGYAIVIGRSKRTVPGLKKVLFVCDRAGKPPRRVTPENRKRKTTSRKCDCQFGFFAIEQRTQWTVRYRPDPAHLVHNHGPSESPLLHPAARKLDSSMVAAVKALKENGVGVSQTLEILQQENPHVPLLPRDIYNARAAINRNPQKVATGLAENRPAIYSKPHPSAEERIRADLRREIAKAREDLDKLREDSKKEIDELKAKLADKDKQIARFEQFIDICNQRVMVRLSDSNDADGGTANSNP